MPLLEGLRVFCRDVSVLVYRKFGQLFIQLDKGVVRVGHDADRKSLEITDVFEEELARVLPEGLVIVSEESVLNHLLLVALHQKLHDFVGVAHPQCLRLFESVHEVEVERLVRISNQRVRRRVVLVVERQAPGCLFRLAGQAHSCVKLSPNRQVPLQRPLVELKPHFFVVINLVLGRELVEK